MPLACVNTVSGSVSISYTDEEAEGEEEYSIQDICSEVSRLKSIVTHLQTTCRSNTRSAGGEQSAGVACEWETKEIGSDIISIIISISTSITKQHDQAVRLLVAISVESIRKDYFELGRWVGRRSRKCTVSVRPWPCLDAATTPEAKYEAPTSRHRILVLFPSTLAQRAKLSNSKVCTLVGLVAALISSSIVASQNQISE